MNMDSSYGIKILNKTNNNNKNGEERKKNTTRPVNLANVKKGARVMFQLEYNTASVSYYLYAFSSLGIRGMGREREIDRKKKKYYVFFFSPLFLCAGDVS